MSKKEICLVGLLIFVLFGGLAFGAYFHNLEVESQPKFIDVDGKKCRLYEVEVGQTSHGAVITETRATCKD